MSMSKKPMPEKIECICPMLPLVYFPKYVYTEYTVEVLHLSGLMRAALCSQKALAAQHWLAWTAGVVPPPATER